MRKLVWLALLVGVVGISRPTSAEVLDDKWFTMFKLDQLENRWLDGEDVAAASGQFRIGDDFNKVSLRAEAEFLENQSRFETAEFQLRYRRLISTFFDAHIGVRYDVNPIPQRTYGVFGISGLAPHWFEVDASAFISDKGDASIRLEAEYDLLITQKLILEPSLETNIAFTDDEPTGVGKGFSDVEIGLRLRYEIAREVAPYIGMNWERKFGNTARFAKAEEEDTDVLSFVAGIRVMF